MASPRRKKSKHMFTAISKDRVDHYLLAWLHATYYLRGKRGKSSILGNSTQSTLVGYSSGNSILSIFGSTFIITISQHPNIMFLKK